MRNALACALVLLVTSATVNGGTVINEWNVNDTQKWELTASASIRILASDSDVFSFEAYDSVTGDAVNIDLIETDPSGVTGTVKIRVAADPSSARVYGAAGVRAVDLSTADTGVLSGLNISGGLGYDDGVTVDDVDGDLTMAGSLYNTCDFGDVDPGVTITIVDGRLTGTLLANTLGNVINRDNK